MPLVRHPETAVRSVGRAEPATDPARQPERSVLPGLLVAGFGAVVAVLVSGLAASISTAVVAVAIGVLIANMRSSRRLSASARPGLDLAAKRVLRIGVVLLGLRLSLGDVAALGGRGLTIVVATVAVTFFGTQWLARRLGLSPGLGLVVATGYSICGASAIAAVESSSDADGEEVAAAVGLVTLYGSLAIVVLPTLAAVFGLDDAQFGAWAGASVHDVAQVVATASPGGESVVATAMVVKLTRVALLSPIVAGVGIHRRLVAGPGARVDADADGRGDSERTDRGGPAILPLFVVGFLAAVALRTSGLLGTELLDGARSAERWVLAVALVGLGSTVRFDRLRRLGPKPLLLGALAWVLVAATSLAGILLIGFA